MEIAVIAASVILLSAGIFFLAVKKFLAGIVLLGLAGYGLFYGIGTLSLKIKATIGKKRYYKYFEDTLREHPELGNHRRFYGERGVLLILSKSGYVAYFQGENFTRKNIDEVKSIQFMTDPEKTKKTAGTIFYRLETADSSNPVVDLPFGYYRDNADKDRERDEFSRVEDTFYSYKRKAPKDEAPRGQAAGQTSE